ncbi:hypothetical protein LMJF_02_0400 [Leishmania major strain Friedlin]|uniref:Uncharacterized protein n=1 Tax=Leishmania major TaxID=5664 RepID=E9ACB5_LEIMA|nr:hypothetical protein LMJF_02_0400 [Leishmania major strain Friedlin]CAG9567191.1 ubiquitin-conjugating_enzyme_E2_-_putative [Leishmania major strain Friedlin]CBZ11930.1 hypothetical protein LMJF_02_0400 [Leishmania major strain Friedlin]|eukprot:XP_003721646.1 hypothetical protein LMJF_02_0400 [Leishmania major strain Friedlin]
MCVRALLYWMLLLLLLSPMQLFISLFLHSFSSKLCHSAIILPVLNALLLQLSLAR